ncbi:hypothetical protein [Streptosporangium sp. NPDC000396]
MSRLNARLTMYGRRRARGYPYGCRLLGWRPYGYPWGEITSSKVRAHR